MATFRNLDRLAGQVGLAVENLRVMRMRQQADQLRQQRIAQEMQFRTMLKQKEIDAANLRQKKDLAYKERDSIRDYKASLARTQMMKDRNEALRKQNEISERVSDYNRAVNTSKILFGSQIGTAEARLKALEAMRYSTDEFVRKPTQLELETAQAMVRNAYRQQAQYLKDTMAQVDPTFEVPIPTETIQGYMDEAVSQWPPWTQTGDSTQLNIKAIEQKPKQDRFGIRK